MLYLATYIDIGTHFRDATYALEGDSFLIILAYDRIQKLIKLKSTWQHPRLSSIAQALHDKQDPNNFNPNLKSIVEDTGRQCALGAINYIEQKYTLVQTYIFFSSHLLMCNIIQRLVHVIQLII